MRHITKNRPALRWLLPMLTVLLLAAPASAQIEQLQGTQAAAVGAYNSRNWQGAADHAASYIEQLEAADLPKAGPDFALVSFIAGHARFELWKAQPDTFGYDFEDDVLGAMKDSLEILQDDPFFKYNILGTAYFEKLKSTDFRDLELENAASWYLFKALTARADELADVPRESQEYADYSKYVLHYISRTFEMARYSKVPEIYLIRVREACRLGFGSEYDERFLQLYQVIGFDNGNVRAGVLWQTGLDMMNTPDSDAEEVLATFKEAAQITRGRKPRAEIYRQMADHASRQDDQQFKLQAVEYGRMAFRLDPANPEIQAQYGTSLHVLSYAHFNQGRFKQALKAAQEATSFDWDGDEVAFFDLSRAQANFGDKINALTHAEKAFDKARRKLPADEAQPYRQNFLNILRQFGLSSKAAQVEKETLGQPNTASADASAGEQGS